MALRARGHGRRGRTALLGRRSIRAEAQDHFAAAPVSVRADPRGWEEVPALSQARLHLGAATPGRGYTWARLRRGAATPPRRARALPICRVRG
jgi:hypothetical protein